MVTYPSVAIPPVEAAVVLGGTPYAACIRPQLDGNYLSLGSFRPDEDSLIYARLGPYMQLCIRDVDFVALLGRLDVQLPAPHSMDLRWFGDFWMVGGRAACDYPEERRSFESLHLSTARREEATRIRLRGILGARRDPGDWPEKLELDMWFVVPDHEVDRFVLGAEANQLFRSSVMR